MDMEKIVKALECLKEGSYCECCDYKPYDDCIKRVATDALSILKEQEAVKPEPIMGTSISDCGKCRHAVAPGMNYCPVCGCRIDWN